MGSNADVQSSIDDDENGRQREIKGDQMFSNEKYSMVSDFAVS